MPVEACTRLNPTTQDRSWSFSPSNGQWLRNSMSTCMGQPSMYTPITTHSCMHYPQPSWMQPVTTGLPAWQIIIFRLHYRAGKANIDADALLRVSWPGCMSDNSGTHLKVTAPAVQAVKKAALKGSASPIEAYSCNLHILDAIQDSMQVAFMTLEDWHQAQEVDPALSLIIARLRDGMLGKGQSNTTDPPKSVSTGGSVIIYCSKRVSCTGGPCPGCQRRSSFS